MLSAARLQTALSHAEGIASLAKDYQSRGVAVVAISSNSVKTHPQDGPDEMAADAKQFGMCFLSCMSSLSCSPCVDLIGVAKCQCIFR